MSGEGCLLIGYARVSTDEQDFQAQHDGLIRLGVPEKRICIDRGRICKNRERHGLDEALATCHTGDTLAVTKLDRLARSIRDATDIAEESGLQGKNRGSV